MYWAKALREMMDGPLDRVLWEMLQILVMLQILAILETLEIWQILET